MIMVNRGFTLLEAIVSIFIVTVGVGGVFMLINQTISSGQNVSSKLKATYLAQEGIENIRNVRDSNWLKQRANPAVLWDEGITSSGWQPVVFIDGTQSNFQRKITITPMADILKVLVEVSWQERGNTHQAAVQENLYKWLQ